MWEIYKKNCFDFSRPGKIINYTWDEEKMRNLTYYKNLQGKYFKKLNF